MKIKQITVRMDEIHWKRFLMALETAFFHIPFAGLSDSKKVLFGLEHVSGVLEEITRDPKDHTVRPEARIFRTVEFGKHGCKEIRDERKKILAARRASK